MPSFYRRGQGPGRPRDLPESTQLESAVGGSHEKAPASLVTYNHPSVSLATTNQNWPLWPTEHGRNDSVWLPRPTQERPCSSALASCTICPGGSHPRSTSSLPQPAGSKRGLQPPAGTDLPAERVSESLWKSVPAPAQPPRCSPADTGLQSHDRPQVRSACPRRSPVPNPQDRGR